MLQLTQKLGSGEMRVQEVPAPMCEWGTVVVKNRYSLISAGTEGSSVRAARSSLIQKARQRPAQVRQVIESIKRQGIMATYRAVQKKLDSYSPLGYSCAGEVVAVGEGVPEIVRGDLVACAGAGYANHAEFISVPANLCVKLHRDADLKLAAFNTMGAIALQGVRQSEIRLGENCAVIGLGLIGQLTRRLLCAAGAKAIGIDVDPWAVEVAGRNTTDAAWTRDEPGLEEKISQLTGGLGVDAVIITAATDSTDPINFAGRIARQKGRVVVVGAVPTGFERESYYRKELELRMSCSYGPGRYDPAYEEHGLDYPAGYVRWTEQRNMQAFQEMIHAGRLPLADLITHQFALEDAEKAYDLILAHKERYLGIILRYDAAQPLAHQPVAVHEGVSKEARVSIAFIGAGSYAQGSLLPNLPHSSRIARRAVVTSNGTTSKRVAEKFGFESCTSDPAEILAREDINTVFIATRHDTHARYVAEALRAGKRIFVEKPLALDEDELAGIEALYNDAIANGAQPMLMVGFNRRFSRLAKAAKQALGGGPMSMVYRINAGQIPASHWIQDPAVGGGRIVGEACHFIDLMTFFCGSLPVRVYASALPGQQQTPDTVTATIEFADGSIGSLSYFANGSKAIEKEYIEAHSFGNTAILRDFSTLELGLGGTVRKSSLRTQDKGQPAMLSKFVQALETGGPSPIPFEEIRAVTRATFGILRSIREHQAVAL
jgi:polar amino acid transport system substrate-binding protein